MKGQLIARGSKCISALLVLIVLPVSARVSAEEPYFIQVYCLKSDLVPIEDNSPGPLGQLVFFADTRSNLDGDPGKDWAEDLAVFDVGTMIQKERLRLDGATLRLKRDELTCGGLPLSYMAKFTFHTMLESLNDTAVLPLPPRDQSSEYLVSKGDGIFELRHLDVPLGLEFTLRKQNGRLRLMVKHDLIVGRNALPGTALSVGAPIVRRLDGGTSLSVTAEGTYAAAFAYHDPESGEVLPCIVLITPRSVKAADEEAHASEPSPIQYSTEFKIVHFVDDALIRDSRCHPVEIFETVDGAAIYRLEKDVVTLDLLDDHGGRLVAAPRGTGIDASLPVESREGVLFKIIMRNGGRGGFGGGSGTFEQGGEAFTQPTDHKSLSSESSMLNDVPKFGDSTVHLLEPFTSWLAPGYAQLFSKERIVSSVVVIDDQLKDYPGDTGLMAMIWCSSTSTPEVINREFYLSLCERDAQDEQIRWLYANGPVQLNTDYLLVPEMQPLHGWEVVVINTREVVTDATRYFEDPHSSIQGSQAP